jgi:hypothetical protein
VVLQISLLKGLFYYDMVRSEHDILIIFYVLGSEEPLVHIPTAMPLDALRWNPSNQDEVYHLYQEPHTSC